MNPEDFTSEAVDGTELFDDIRAFLSRFIAFPSPAALVAVVLWIVHTYVADKLDNSPRLALLSPEPGSGKTRVLELLELLVHHPMLVFNASVAAIFRTLHKGAVTLLFDEVDTIFGTEKKDDPSADLRGLLNAGHRQGAKIPRCVGPNHEVEHFPVFCPVALAGLGDLPETVMSRSIVIRMRRRRPDEHVKPFRRRAHESTAAALRERLAHWAASHQEAIHGAWPEMPSGVTDRAADVWEPLLAVADAAGDDWAKQAREACTELVAHAQDRTVAVSEGVQLLHDVHEVFGSEKFVPTRDLLRGLHALEDAPWFDLRGGPLTPHGLAKRLKPYGVKPEKNRLNREATTRGYHREDFLDPWRSYAPSLIPETPEQAEQPEHRRSERSGSVPDAEPVPEHDPEAEHNAPSLTSDVPVVPDVPGPRGRSASAVPGASPARPPPCKGSAGSAPPTSPSRPDRAPTLVNPTEGDARCPVASTTVAPRRPPTTHRTTRGT